MTHDNGRKPATTGDFTPTTEPTRSGPLSHITLALPGGRHDVKRHLQVLTRTLPIGREDLLAPLRRAPVGNVAADLMARQQAEIDLATLLRDDDAPFLTTPLNDVDFTGGLIEQTRDDHGRLRSLTVKPWAGDDVVVHANGAAFFAHWCLTVAATPPVNLFAPVVPMGTTFQLTARLIASTDAVLYSDWDDEEIWETAAEEGEGEE